MDLDSVQLAKQIAFGNGDTLPPHALEFVRAGFRRYFQDGAGLELAFHLDGTSRKAARNRYLVMASIVLDDGRQLSKWELAGELEIALRRFESRILPGITHGDSGGLTPINEFLWLVVESGVCQIRSQRSLYELLKN